MNTKPIEDFSTCLPPVCEFKLMPWTQSFGGDYYGALKIAAEYCGLSDVPARFPGSWQHGTWPPWQKIRPEVIVFNAPKTARCFVAREDEATFLKEGGYRDVRAIGLPIIYTKPSGLQRIPKSLLVMPTHSLASDVLVPATERYVREIASVRPKFGTVAACVSAPCIAKGLWTPQFEAEGIQVVRGAGIDDINALKRMRALFETFEYVTTDSYGSHVFYALYFGAKVSIWGSATPVLRGNILSDGAWTPYPEAVDKLLSEETDRKAEAYLGPLRVDPWIGVENFEATNAMVGHDHKLSPEDMRAVFGWTPLRNFVGFGGKLLRRSSFWRAASAAKQRLLRPTKNSLR